MRRARGRGRTLPPGHRRDLADGRRSALARGRRRAALAGALLAGAALAPPLGAGATPALRAPRATTGVALHAGETTVGLQGAVNPHGQETTCWFQFGATTAYGGQTPTAAVGAGTVAVKVDQALTGLLPGTTYHYRLVATSAGGTVDGQDHTFTTRRIPLKFVLPKAAKTGTFGSSFTLSGTLSGTGGAGRQVVLQSSAFPYLGGFADVGAPVSTNAEGGFSLRVPSLAQSVELRVRTVEPAPTYSPAVTVRVAVAVTLRARASAQGDLLSGTVTPAAVGAPVVFQWMRAGRPPVKLASTVVRRGGGHTARFVATVSVRHGGWYRALVKVDGGRFVPGASRPVLLRATPRVRGTHRRHR